MAVGDSSVMFGKSAHYRYPDYWLPYLLQRVFTKENNSKKGIGVNITFDGSNDGLENKIPFLTCGVVESHRDRVTKGNGLYLAGWIDHQEVPKEFDGKLCTTTFTDGVIIKSYFLPIEILNNQEKVHQCIIKPQKLVDVKEIVEFWDNNGFGFSNMNAKEQLLAWLDDSKFLQPKALILKAMNIACANNKRRLSYVVGILKNWNNDSLLTVAEIDSFYESENSRPKHRQSRETIPCGRPIPGRFKLDITAGEEE